MLARTVRRTREARTAASQWSNNARPTPWRWYSGATPSVMIQAGSPGSQG
ncbi:MAG: hypothetical protein HC915_18680 [Anaerolineae bacterium]|nr:hypothetical protein [Anaerolineae bacterium]